MLTYRLCTSPSKQLQGLLFRNVIGTVGIDAYRELNPEHYFLLMSSIATSRGICVVVKDVNTIGYVIACERGIGHTYQVEILDIYVAPSFRRRGVAADLLKRVEAWAIERGAKRMLVQVSPSNARAISLYERVGMRTSTLMMERTLSAGESIKAS